MSDADVPRAAEVRAKTSPRRPDRERALPLLIATILPKRGTTGVQAHFRELRRYLDRLGTRSDLVTPSCWGRPLTVPVFGFRRLLEWCSKPASVCWYRQWHEVFLRHALRRRLASPGSCVVYAQCPVSARAALRARRGPHQRVVLAVHFRISQSDEWADKGQIPRDGAVFAGIRRLERNRGQVLAAQRPRQAAGTLVSLLSREPERARAGRAARARFHRDHDADIVGPRLLHFLQASEPAGPGAAGF